MNAQKFITLAYVGSRFVALLALGAALTARLAAAATFTIDAIHLHEELAPGSDGIMVADPANPRPDQAKIYIPQVELDVRVSQDAQSRNLLAKVYFYDEAGNMIKACTAPAAAQRFVAEAGRTSVLSSAWPTILPADSRQALYFPVPAQFPTGGSVVAVFGNANGAVAAAEPDGREQTLDFPEKELVAKTMLAPDVALLDGAAAVPLIEQKVDSDNPRYPAFTLLVHLPHGVSSPREVRGVLAMCLLAKSVSQIRDQLNAIKPAGDPNPYFAFAEKQKLAIVAWGARWVWNSYANFDELDEDQIHSWDDNFQQLADAWDRGIQLLVQNDGLPDRDYLMYGLCAGGEWVHRLALHRPDRFLAVQMHISTSYDAPTPEASRIMWLLTTGELDSGSDRARRFYTAARALNYPIIFKAVLGLGHANSPIADQLGVRFFTYALAQKARRDAANQSDITQAQPLDLSAFDAPPYYGDLMNQVMFAAHDKNMIPSDYLVPLPNKEIAEAWNR